MVNEYERRNGLRVRARSRVCVAQLSNIEIFSDAVRVLATCLTSSTAVNGGTLGFSFCVSMGRRASNDRWRFLSLTNRVDRIGLNVLVLIFVDLLLQIWETFIG